MKKCISLILYLFLIFSINPAFGDDSFSTTEKMRGEKLSGNCSHGLHPLKNSPYSLYISCEGALGNYLGIILSAKWSKHGNKVWDIGNRYWFENGWGKDVDSYIYDTTSKRLYIATSSYYGLGGIYRLNIKDKSSTLIYPNSIEQVKSEEEFSLISLSEDKVLSIQHTNFDGETKEIKIPVGRK